MSPVIRFNMKNLDLLNFWSLKQRTLTTYNIPKVDLFFGRGKTAFAKTNDPPPQKKYTVAQLWSLPPPPPPPRPRPPPPPPRAMGLPTHVFLLLLLLRSGCSGYVWFHTPRTHAHTQHVVEGEEEERPELKHPVISLLGPHLQAYLQVGTASS